MESSQAISSEEKEEDSNENHEELSAVRNLEIQMAALLKRVEELEAENQRLLQGTATATCNATNHPKNEESASVHELKQNEYIVSNNNDANNKYSGTEELPVEENPASINQTQPSQSQRRWRKLHKSFEESFGNNDGGSDGRSNLVFLHPEEVGNRNYTPSELERLQQRPFHTRLFITNTQLEWNTVWLRTRHTDHHAHHSSFIQVRDVFKADAITNHPIAAKYALTELLNMCYSMEDSDYYSFACTIASAFSRGASNTDFERALLLHPARIENLEQQSTVPGDSESPMDKKDKQHAHHALLLQEQERARRRLIELMDIVFTKLKQKQLLVNENKSNIFRLALCLTRHSNNHWPILYAFFSFFFQLCSAVYVLLSLTPLEESPLAEPEYIALALGAAFYGTMVAAPKMKSTHEMFRHLYQFSDWRWMSFLAGMDFIVNFVLPLTVAVCGFFVVLKAGSLLGCVLNAVALLFITEIDDCLPALLEMDVSDIVQGFLMDQALYEYETQQHDDQGLKRKDLPSIEFSDILITNTPESGSISSRGITFQPYEIFGGESMQSNDKDDIVRSQSHGIAAIVDIPEDEECDGPNQQSSSFNHRSYTRKNSIESSQRVRTGDLGQQVTNRRCLTVDCLLRKVEWQYTGGFETSSSPRIGHLRLQKLGNGQWIDIVGKQKATLQDNRPWFRLTGVYVITSFCMSDDVLRLRVCGSQTAKEFQKAFEYYNLWSLGVHAENLLKNAEKMTLTPTELQQNEQVLKRPPRM